MVPLVREVPPTILKRRPARRRWSAHEHAGHLARVLIDPAPVMWEQQQGAGTQAQMQLWHAMSDIETQDSKSIVDVALEDEALKKDLDALLTLTRP